MKSVGYSTFERLEINFIIEFSRSVVCLIFHIYAWDGLPVNITELSWHYQYPIFVIFIVARSANCLIFLFTGGLCEVFQVIWNHRLQTDRNLWMEPM